MIIDIDFTHIVWNWIKTSGAKQDGRNDVIVYVSGIGTNGDPFQKDRIDSSDERNRLSYGTDQGPKICLKKLGSGHDCVTKLNNIYSMKVMDNE